VEGVNTLAILAGFLALLVSGLTSVVALGLLVARHTRAARVLFAAGLLAAVLIMAVAMFSFFAPEYRGHAGAAMILIVALSLLLAGAGQFAAALRGGWTYAAALACAVAAVALVASPVVVGDRSVALLGDFGLRFMDWGLPVLVVAGLFPVGASALIGALVLPPSRRTERSGRSRGDAD
jgi:hypothetical protein